MFEHHDRDLNVARFEALAVKKSEVETAFGGPLTWETRDWLKSTRIASYAEVADVALTDQWDAWIGWLVNTGEQMRTAFAAVGGVPLPAGVVETAPTGV